MDVERLGADVDGLVSADGSRISRRLFFDPSVYERERERLFQRCWLYVGHVSQIPDPGDYITAYMGEEPVIVTRAPDSRIHVLVNSCSHRGTKICRTHEGNASTFTCPYHGWRFDNDGSLRGVPYTSSYGGRLDKDGLGLHRAAQVDECLGLIFATFDPDAVPLREYLGDEQVFYLETIFGRSERPVRILKGTHRWRINCNWKVPVENHAPDMIHVAPSHRAAFGALGTDDFNVGQGSQIVTQQGHLFASRFLDVDSGIDERLPGDGMAAFPASAEFLRARQPEAEARLGPVRSRLNPISATVFPNFSVVPTNFTIRVSHPRGPGVTEMWSWCFAPADAPDAVVAEILAVYETMLGPAGFLEAEDGENWTAMTLGARSSRTDPRPLTVGMGLGQEWVHDELPGSFGALWSEHNQRGFYRHWRGSMEPGRRG